MSSTEQNKFNFSLYQGSVNFLSNSETVFNKEILLCERMFDADSFNPFTRYSIDIRDILPKSITKLQKILSKRSYNFNYDVGNDQEYDLLEHYDNIINSLPKKWVNSFRYNPHSQTQRIEDKVIKGVPCRIGLYINEHPIVERIFYVDNFNPLSRFSTDVTNTVIEIVNEIYNRIKKEDIKNMWDDYDLINRKGFNINEIREMSLGRRKYFLNTLN